MNCIYLIKYIIFLTILCPAFFIMLQYQSFFINAFGDSSQCQALKLLLNLKNENKSLLTTTLPQTPLVILPKSFFLLS